MIIYFTVANDVHQIKAINEYLRSQLLSCESVISVETINGNLVKIWVNNEKKIVEEKPTLPKVEEIKVIPDHKSAPPKVEEIKVISDHKPLVEQKKTITEENNLVEFVPVVNNTFISKADRLNMELEKQNAPSSVIGTTNKGIDDTSVLVAKNKKH